MSARIATLVLLALLAPALGSGPAASTPPLEHVDAFPSGFQVSFDLGGLPDDVPTGGGAVPLVVAGYGPTTVLRSDPYVDPEAGGWVIDTEIVDMQLSGSHPVLGDLLITESPAFASRGRITDVVLDSNGNFVEGVSTFDVFFEVTLVNAPPDLALSPNLKNLKPFAMGPQRIFSLPPTGNAYYHPPARPVAVWGSVAGVLGVVGYSTSGCHYVIPTSGASHGICLAVHGRPDPTTPGCVLGAALVRASDASSPAHTLASVAGFPVGAATAPWRDLDGDTIFETVIVSTQPAGCATLTLTATGTFTDGHTATGTISWLQRL